MYLSDPVRMGQRPMGTQTGISYRSGIVRLGQHRMRTCPEHFSADHRPHDPRNRRGGLRRLGRVGRPYSTHSSDTGVHGRGDRHRIGVHDRHTRGSAIGCKHRPEWPFLCFGRAWLFGDDSRRHFISAGTPIRTARATDGFQTHSLTRRVAAPIHRHVCSFLCAESLLLHLSAQLDGTWPRKGRALESLSHHFSTQRPASFSLRATRRETRPFPSADFYRLVRSDSGLSTLSGSGSARLLAVFERRRFFLRLQSLSTHLAGLSHAANTPGRSRHGHRCLYVFWVHRIVARRHVRWRTAPYLSVSSGVRRRYAFGHLVFPRLAQSTRFHFLKSLLKKAHRMFEDRR